MENHVKHLNNSGELSHQSYLIRYVQLMKVIIELHSYHISQKFLLIYNHNLKSRYPISLILENKHVNCNNALYSM